MSDDTNKDPLDLKYVATLLSEEALNDATKLLIEIMNGEVNPEDEAEKWVRAYAPEHLNSPKAS